MRIGIDLGGTKVEGIALDGSGDFARQRVFDAARRRSFVVLQRMREEGKITADQEQEARRGAEAAERIGQHRGRPLHDVAFGQRRQLLYDRGLH